MVSLELAAKSADMHTCNNALPSNTHPLIPLFTLTGLWDEWNVWPRVLDK